MGGLFEVEKLEQEKKELENKINKSNFWEDQTMANMTYQQFKNIKKKLDLYNDLKDNIDLYLELIELEDINDKDIINLQEELEDLEIRTLLKGKYDGNDCYLEIHPGAGGTESCDWASMLLRMYERFCDKNNYTYKVIEKQPGEEAGIKSVTLEIAGEYAYGYLKNEKGVHRLVRISPFDSAKRRHTSFASVMVTPVFTNNVDIEIKEEDLKIDVYHSSGAGGQSVNTSNSAVRITHLPTKIVVTCQTERSQLRNKEIALEILKSKIFEQQEEQREKELKNITGDISETSFGSQIRSYILEPYKLVKDHRSNYEENDPLKVLDGDIKGLMESVLKKIN